MSDGVPAPCVAQREPRCATTSCRDCRLPHVDTEKLGKIVGRLWTPAHSGMFATDLRISGEAGSPDVTRWRCMQKTNNANTMSLTTFQRRHAPCSSW